MRELIAAKQACARRFGEVKRAGGDVDALKAEMQRITAALAEAEAALQAARQEPASQTAPERARVPPRFAWAPPSATESTGVISVAGATPADREDWDAYVAAHPAASMYHHGTWREMIAREMKHRDASLLARDAAGRLCGVLPLIEMRSRLFGHFAVSLPYFNYGGPLADSAAVESALLAAAGDAASAHGLAHVEVRETRPRPGWPARDNKVAMIRRLPASNAELDAELGSKLRAQVKRAEREGPRVRIGGAELLDAFYAVFARNMRDLGTPVYARSFFAAVLQAWPQRSHIVVLELGGKPVGGAILLGYRDMLEIPWASTLREVNAAGINMLMYRAVLGFAIEQGYGWFDFGRSTVDAGTYRFKKQWGAQPLQNHWHYWLPPGKSLPQLNPDNPKYRLMIAVWQRLPVALTRLVGPPVVRNLP